MRLSNARQWYTIQQHTELPFFQREKELVWVEFEFMTLRSLGTSAHQLSYLGSPAGKRLNVIYNYCYKRIILTAKVCLTMLPKNEFNIAISQQMNLTVTVAGNLTLQC